MLYSLYFKKLSSKIHSLTHSLSESEELLLLVLLNVSIDDDRFFHRSNVGILVAFVVFVAFLAQVVLNPNHEFTIIDFSFEQHSIVLSNEMHHRR
mmetsp:Transcript_14833/g.41983  ORF Transcript_14833/g.41983 Transcript_14833/m.41983 type:complete len:95 (+) Transcript_14833:1793-2077(+)